MTSKENVLMLAAGKQTRMNGFLDIPKGLVQIASGQTIAEIIINQLENTPVIITNPDFEKKFKEKFPDLKILNIGGAGAIADLIVSLNKLQWWENDLVILPSDTLIKFNLQEFIEIAQEKNAFVTVGQRQPKDKIANRLGCLVIGNKDEDDDLFEVKEFIEKPESPPSDIAAVPFYVIPKNILQFIRDNQDQLTSLDAPGKLIEWLLNNNQEVFVYITDQDTLDVGKPEDIEKAKLF